MIERAFVLRSAVPELATNGRVASYLTLDSRVNMILLIKDFDWVDRKKSECWRCPKCKHFILPADKVKTKNDIRYHDLCKPPKKETQNDGASSTIAP